MKGTARLQAKETSLTDAVRRAQMSTRVGMSANGKWEHVVQLFHKMRYQDDDTEKNIEKNTAREAHP